MMCDSKCINMVYDSGNISSGISHNSKSTNTLSNNSKGNSSGKLKLSIPRRMNEGSNINSDNNNNPNNNKLNNNNDSDLYNNISDNQNIINE